MNDIDREYLRLLKKTLEEGIKRPSRAGNVISIFGEQIKFDLKKGFPILTTKKVFTKGVLYELLWFLQRYTNYHQSMNIEYLYRNGVHIWDDDAYRWYKEWIEKHIIDKESQFYFTMPTNDDTVRQKDGSYIHPQFQIWLENDERKNDISFLKNLTQSEFNDLVLQKVEINLKSNDEKYRFGDLGKVYGAQWRMWGEESIDQLGMIIDKLKTNPNDRRLLCTAYNPSYLDKVALPPCHVMFQFYARPLTEEEFKRYKGRKKNPPTYALSCMWTQRSCDLFLGVTFNIVSYAFLTHMVAKLVNMVPDMLIGSLGDCHIYEAHLDAVNEQLSRNGSDIYPHLIINGKQKTLEDFEFEDFEIDDYYSDGVIRAPLMTGLEKK